MSEKQFVFATLSYNFHENAKIVVISVFSLRCQAIHEILFFLFIHFIVFVCYIVLLFKVFFFHSQFYWYKAVNMVQINFIS